MPILLNLRRLPHSGTWISKGGFKWIYQNKILNCVVFFKDYVVKNFILFCSKAIKLEKKAFNKGGYG